MREGKVEVEKRVADFYEEKKTVCSGSFKLGGHAGLGLLFKRQEWCQRPTRNDFPIRHSQFRSAAV